MLQDNFNSVSEIPTAFNATLDMTTRTFRYNRCKPSVTGLSHSIWYSTNLTTWSRDTRAVQGRPTTNGELETVPITLSNSLLAEPKLFIQIRAE
jgi:hypothetical protein